ncbi:hypothetical protein C8R47DRAFT_997886 [Mycena vitilis]|nr:hypothetical protein C8R47DRAFT_997886 [Mycena vitilis]
MPATSKASTGPPQALIYRIEYLQQLLKHLPLSLPVDPPESLYQFYLDEDRITETGGAVYPVASRALEMSFGTWRDRNAAVKFTERGSCVVALGPFLKKVIRRLSPSERDSFEDAWIGRLIDAAKTSGATIPPRTSKGRVREPEEEELSDAPPMKRGRVGAPIILDSNDDDDTEGPSKLSGSSSATPTQTIAPNTVIPSTTDVNLVANTQATLATMGWQKWLPGAKETHLKTESRLHREGAEETKKRMEKEKEEKQERARELTAARQRRFREKKKAAGEEEEDLTDDENSNIVLMRGADAAGHERQLVVAETSRVGTQNWRAKRNGTKGGAVQKKTVSVNWFHPFSFGPIEKEMRRTGWSPSAAVRNLKCDSPLLYKGLQKGTVSRWQVKGKNEWKADTLDKIGSGKAITASGRTGILAPYPDIMDTVKETLTGLRTAGGIVNVSIARGLLLSEISQRQPQLLNQFKTSETYVRNFLASVMDWTPRKGTRTARHILDNAPILLKRTFFRLRYAILTGRIPPEVRVHHFIINCNFCYRSILSQRVAKHILHQDSLDFLVDTFKAQSARGVAPKDVKFPNSLPILRNATVRGLVKMYDFFQTIEGRKVVKQVLYRSFPNSRIN